MTTSEPSCSRLSQARPIGRCSTLLILNICQAFGGSCTIWRSCRRQMRRSLPSRLDYCLPCWQPHCPVPLQSRHRERSKNGKSTMKIFISSLITDMHEERSAVREAIEQLDHEPIMAEHFGGQPNSSQVACLNGVRDRTRSCSPHGPEQGPETRGIHLTAPTRSRPEQQRACRAGVPYVRPLPVVRDLREGADLRGSCRRHDRRSRKACRRAVP
jgi:Domain of unknown function (DUF4062)